MRLVGTRYPPRINLAPYRASRAAHDFAYSNGPTLPSISWGIDLCHLSSSTALFHREYHPAFCNLPIRDVSSFLARRPRLDESIAARIVETGVDPYHHLLNLPLLLGTESPVLPAAMCGAVACARDLGPNPLDLTPSVVEVACDFPAGDDVGELLHSIYWGAPLPNARRPANEWYTTSYRWHLSRSHDKAFIHPPGISRSVHPVGTYRPEVRCPIRMYLRPSTGMLRLEFSVTNTQLHRLLLRPGHEKKRLTLRRVLWNWDLLAAFVHRRFEPIFAAGFLPAPVLPTYDDMKALRDGLSAKRRALPAPELPREWEIDSSPLPVPAVVPDGVGWE